ncbi:phage major capsid protein [Lacicoccus qingdaonensis]|uniref:Phage major capsid protein, HK97 family n=1 Tax=Lacicoccus qingdaonensis TaxID=576118 RepID=A0A1G9F2A3_9BACL|nr:phage major capsid protein [Salinicoccus qingdaonensis]SDK82425.1 phage major capsid protein, HK97 family [Salinicoccus qingdaonensis]
MAIKFGDTMKNYQEKKDAFVNAVQEGANDEKQNELFGEMFDAMTNDLSDEVRKSVAEENYDSSVLTARGANTLTNEEKKFYNELTTDVGYKEESLIPETILTRVFDELENEYPFLQTINIETMGVRTRIIEAEPEGQVVWGKIFGDIRGQLDAVFTERDLTLGKATCYVVLPKDLKDTGVTYIDAFVRAQIREAYSVAFAKMAIEGRGANQNEPVGLMKEINADTGAVTDKTSSGTLTFADADTAIEEFTDALSKLSVYGENGDKYRNVRGRVAVAVNPVNALFAESKFMKVTENNVYVTATPFGVEIVENKFVPADKAVVYIKDNYTLGVGGDKIVRMYDQTLAIEDCDLYTAKQFAYGEPKDNTSSLVYDLSIGGAELPEV